MATTTPNFGWPVPTSTDLVKDGATAIEALGDGIDTSLVDLKGGTTGQVLSKATSADMDFAWVTSDDANAIQNTIVDAKGDLIGATAADTPARLAVGTNGQVLTADSTASTGLAWATPSVGSTYVAGKNGLVNSAFDVWQRSTSATFAGTVAWVAADRWFGVALGSSPTCTMSRQTADNTFLTYGMRFGRNSGQTATGDVYVGNTLESIDARRFAGQTVTLSFYVKSGANAPTSFVSQIRTGTGTDQSSATLFSTGWTGGLNNSQTNTVSTTMTRYTQTVTLGSTVNQIMVLFTYASTGTAGANEWFQVEGVQLEIASAASAFSRNAGTIQGELAACQRYFRVTTYGIMGACVSTTTAQLAIYHPGMRTSPTLAATSAIQISDMISSSITQSSASVSTIAATTEGTWLSLPNFTGLTTGRPATLNSSTGITLSSEL
jgi:hypothetical protein